MSSVMYSVIVHSLYNVAMVQYIHTCVCVCVNVSIAVPCQGIGEM